MVRCQGGESAGSGLWYTGKDQGPLVEAEAMNIYDMVILTTVNAFVMFLVIGMDQWKRSEWNAWEIYKLMNYVFGLFVVLLVFSTLTVPILFTILEEFK